MNLTTDSKVPADTDHEHVMLPKSNDIVCITAIQCLVYGDDVDDLKCSQGERIERYQSEAKASVAVNTVTRNSFNFQINIILSNLEVSLDLDLQPPAIPTGPVVHPSPVDTFLIDDMVRIIEYRILVPFSLSEYCRGIRYTLSRATRLNIVESHAQGGDDDMQVLVYEDCKCIVNKAKLQDGEPRIEHESTNGSTSDGGQVVHGYKMLTRLSSLGRLPSVVKGMLPESACFFDETSFIIFPWVFTSYYSPFFQDKFKFSVTSNHIDDRGTSENCTYLSEKDLSIRIIEDLDITKQLSKDEYRSDEDPLLFQSVKSKRGPLKSGWHLDGSTPCTCVYKVLQSSFDYFGLSKRVEKTLSDGVTLSILRSHRQLVTWQDLWFDLTDEQVKEYEIETISYLKTLQERIKNGEKGITPESEGLAIPKISSAMIAKVIPVPPWLRLRSVCSNCQEESESPTVCEDCRMTFCADCDNVFHKRKERRNHSRTGVHFKCEMCSIQLVSGIFCADCHCVLCRDCSHARHRPRDYRQHRRQTVDASVIWASEDMSRSASFDLNTSVADPFMLACSLGDIPRVAEFLARGASVNKQTLPDGRTGVHHAVLSTQLDMLGFLLDRGASPDISDVDRRTPLMEASRNSCIGAVSLLINAGADINTQDMIGRSALMYACSVGASDLITFIVSRDGVRFDAKDQSGLTALDIALEGQHKEAVGILKGAIVSNHKVIVAQKALQTANQQMEDWQKRLSLKEHELTIKERDLVDAIAQIPSCYKFSESVKDALAIWQTMKNVGRLDKAYHIHLADSRSSPHLDLTGKPSEASIYAGISAAINSVDHLLRTLHNPSILRELHQEEDVAMYEVLCNMIFEYGQTKKRMYGMSPLWLKATRRDLLSFDDANVEIFKL